MQNHHFIPRLLIVIKKLVKIEFYRCAFYWREYLALWALSLMCISFVDILPIWWETWPKVILSTLILLLTNRIFDPSSHELLILNKIDLLNMNKVIHGFYLYNICNFILLLPGELFVLGLILSGLSLSMPVKITLIVVYTTTVLMLKTLSHFNRFGVLASHNVVGMLLSIGLCFPGVFLFSALLDGLIQNRIQQTTLALLICWQILLAAFFPLLSSIISFHLTE